MATVKWLPEALHDFERLIAFLGDKSLTAAARAARTILDGAERLADTPELGRAMLDRTGRREIFLPFAAGSYILRYMLEDQRTVVIIRVWHSRVDRS